MGEAQLMMFGEHFVAALCVAAVWLIVCKAIRGLRRRAGFRYFIASVLVVAACVALPDGFETASMLAGVIVLAILYFLYKRALRKHSFEAATIISYENHNVF